MEIIFYDKNGKPTAYSEDGCHIFLYSGKAVAYVCGDAVYGFKGNQFGWFEYGWVRDLQGLCVFFTNLPLSGGPLRAYRRIAPLKYVRQILPVKNVRQIKFLKPYYYNNWANYEALEFFIS